MIARGLLVATALVASAGFGCDKLKPGGSADGGAASTGGGGVFSFLNEEFEGEITSVFTSKGKPQKNVPQQLTFGIKKPKYRVDIAPITGNPDLAAGGALLLDPNAKRGHLLSHTKKTALVIDFERLKSMKGQIPGLPGAPRGTPTAVPAEPPKIDKTGKKETVAGYGCEIWIITSEGKKAEACVAEGITWMDLTDLGFGSPELAVAVLASEANRFPLRVISFDTKGAEETRMEATKVEKKKLEDARFVPPPDYKVIDMAAFMNGGVPGLPSNLPKPRY